MSLSQPIYFTNLIYLHPGQDALFREYERQAIPLMARHGGRLELMVAPAQVQGDLDRPDEIHILTFATSAGFDRYRADPDVIALAPLREQAVARAIFITGRRLTYLDDPDT